MPSNLLNIEKQLVFYGAYHSNKVNVAIHMICVPILIWSGQILFCHIPRPWFFPDFRYDFGPYFSVEFNWSTAVTMTYLMYYFALFPLGTFTYLPQVILQFTSSTAAAHSPTMFKLAAVLHFSSWIAQFYGHGVHEGRSPALLDNFIGAFVLAPFFVHLELLFFLGYFSDLYKRVSNGIGLEIAKFRRQAAAKKRAA